MSDQPSGAVAGKPWIGAKALWRRWEKQRVENSVEPDLRIGIASSFTDLGLTQFVGSHLLQEGFKPDISVGPYNQLFQVCLDPALYFGSACQIIALLWRAEDLLIDEIEAFLAADKGALARAGDKLADLVSAIGKLRTGFAGTVVVSVPPFPTGLSSGPLALDNATGLGAFHRAITAQFVEAVSRIEGVHLFDLEALQRSLGLTATYDARLWYLYHQPFTELFLHQAGILLGRIIIASRRSPKKCVVLDCDNTLWGGVIGEDGLDGIALGDEFPGSAYRDFQKLLLHWRDQGVLLAIASKNNEADVWEVFDQHTGMALKRSDLSAWQINWQTKAQSIAAIAEDLNIGIDSMVFIDDSPMEIDYMRHAWPEVASVLLPEEPAEIVSTLQQMTFFDRLEVTEEDRARADMMRAELDRKALNVNMTKEQFLQALELRIDLFRAGQEDLGRVTQLINKTNQFNLTTMRRTLDEVRALAQSADYRLYALRVADKFGDYGLTGVVVVQVAGGRKTWHLDSLLLSCRVLGRGVEAALLAALAADAAADGADELTAAFIPTRKNALAATFLPSHGFQQRPDGTWRLALADAPKVPDFVEFARAPAAAASRAA
jgi:FkbH-like protein